MEELNAEVVPNLAHPEKKRRGGSGHQWSSSLKKYLTITVVVVGVAAMIAILAHQVYFALSSGLISRVAEAQFAAVFCVPIAYVSALLLVLILRIAAGPVEFKFLGLEFEGAAGPLVFWILCFFSIVWAFKIMWIWER
jgi:hypothetical protein